MPKRWTRDRDYGCEVQQRQATRTRPTEEALCIQDASHGETAPSSRGPTVDGGHRCSVQRNRPCCGQPRCRLPLQLNRRLGQSHVPKDSDSDQPVLLPPPSRIGSQGRSNLVAGRGRTVHGTPIGLQHRAIRSRRPWQERKRARQASHGQNVALSQAFTQGGQTCSLQDRQRKPAEQTEARLGVPCPWEPKMRQGCVDSALISARIAQRQELGRPGYVKVASFCALASIAPRSVASISTHCRS